MEDNFKLNQFIEEDIDAPNNYRDIYSDVVKKTNNLNREAGILAYKDRKDIEVAKSILDGIYPRVKIRDIEKNEEDDDNYYLLYSYDIEESFDDEEDDRLKFSPNLNPAGTPIGKWSGTVTGGMVESDESNSEDPKEKDKLIWAIWDCLEDNSRNYPLDIVQDVVEYIGDFILDSIDDERIKYLPMETRNGQEYYTKIKDDDDLEVILEVLTIDELKEVLKSVKEDREEWERKDERYWEVEEDDPYEPWKDPDSDWYKWRHRNDTNVESLDESTNTYDRWVGDHIVTFNIKKLPYGYRVTGERYNGSYVASREFETREEAVKYIKRVGEPYKKKSRKDSFTVEDVKRLLDKNKINYKGASFEGSGDELRIHFSGDRGYADARWACQALQEAGYDARRTSDIGTWVYIKGLNENNTNESVEKHDTLNQKIFNGDELDPEVKDKLLEIVDRFKYNLEENDIKLDIKDVRIIGSNASYNYTDKSDIDLHIFADLSVYPDQEVLAQKVYDAYKALWNNKFDPIIRGHEVEIYVEPYTGD